MFTALHALAQKSTLMIVISAEGDQLRVSVTPAPTDSKKESSLRPLSLVAAAEELDRDFAQAITIWQAPKQSLLEQAAAAAAPADGEKENETKPAASKPASKPTKAPEKKKAAPSKAAVKSATKASKAATVSTDAAKPWPLPSEAGTESDGQPKSNEQLEAEANEALAVHLTVDENKSINDPATATGDGSGAPLPPSDDSEKTAPSVDEPPPPSDPAPAEPPAANPTQDDFTLELF